MALRVRAAHSETRKGPWAGRAGSEVLCAAMGSTKRPLALKGCGVLKLAWGTGPSAQTSAQR